MTLRRFTELWTPDDWPPVPVAEADLRSVEQRLRVRLPADYRQAVLTVGLPQPNIALLDAIVEHELNLHCVSDFCPPMEIIEETLDWREIGMPKQLFIFANDYCGNKFCFDTDRLNAGSADSCAIWFYDHDFETVNQIAPSFDTWIEAFCNVKLWGQADLS